MVSRTKVAAVSLDDLRLDLLLPKVKRAFLACAKLDFIPCSRWYLAGGTALALQVGHRQSFDFDFFSPRGRFDVMKLERELFNTRLWSTSFRQKGTLYGKFMEAKMSFIAYPFFIPSPMRIRCGNICILPPHDIAAMKIIAISQRGRKRDFIDLYWYCVNREPLDAVVKRAMHQYPGQEHNLPHILKSLIYFEDAEKDPMPRLFFKADWKGIKRYFRREIPRATRELLGLRSRIR